MVDTNSFSVKIFNDLFKSFMCTPIMLAILSFGKEKLSDSLLINSFTKRKYNEISRCVKHKVFCLIQNLVDNFVKSVFIIGSSPRI